MPRAIRVGKKRVRVSKDSKDSREAIISANGKCSPKAQGNYEKYGSCLPPKTIKTIAKSFNERIARETPEKSIPRGAFKSAEQLKVELNKRLECSDERCWLEKGAVDSQTQQALAPLFRPKMPESWKRNPREWLSDTNIRNVMAQYEHNYPSFKFLGVVSVDFQKPEACGRFSMCNFSLFDFLESGKTELGLVINLDSYLGGGTHWVSLYASFNPDSPKFGMCFYDSGAVDPPEYTMKFMRQLRDDAALFFRDNIDNFKKRFRIQCNVKRHQYKNTECGMFSMIFVIACLEYKNKNYAHVCSLLKENSDDTVNTYRKLLFYAT